MSTHQPVEPDETSDEAAFTSSRPLDYVPGILLLIAVGVLGKYAQIWWNALAKHEHWRVPDIEYVLWAIVIGLLITNTIGLHRIFPARCADIRVLAQGRDRRAGRAIRAR